MKTKKQEIIKKTFIACGFMIETIQGYLDGVINEGEYNHNSIELLLKASNHLNTLNKMLLRLFKKIEKESEE